MPKISDSPFADGKYQVELWRCCGHSVSFFCDDIETPTVEAIYCFSDSLCEVPGFAGMGESGANCRTVHVQLHGERKAAVFPELVQVTEGALRYHHTMFDISHAVSFTLGLAAQIDK